jgi:hypothetical protein
MHQETILFDPTSKRFCLLNRTAALLWERLAEPSTVEQVSADICRTFGEADTREVERDVQAVLRELTDLALVVADG